MLLSISQHIKISSEYSCVLDTENKKYFTNGSQFLSFLSQQIYNTHRVNIWPLLINAFPLVYLHTIIILGFLPTIENSHLRINHQMVLVWHYWSSHPVHFSLLTSMYYYSSFLILSILSHSLLTFWIMTVFQSEWCLAFDHFQSSIRMGLRGDFYCCTMSYSSLVIIIDWSGHLPLVRPEWILPEIKTVWCHPIF